MCLSVIVNRFGFGCLIKTFEGKFVCLFCIHLDSAKQLFLFIFPTICGMCYVIQYGVELVKENLGWIF